VADANPCSADEAPDEPLGAVPPGAVPPGAPLGGEPLGGAPGNCAEVDWVASAVGLLMDVATTVDSVDVFVVEEVHAVNKRAAKTINIIHRTYIFLFIFISLLTCL
jgi:hypothetical protein